MQTKKNIMKKPQKTMSNIAVLTWERWINPKSCTPKREITLADLKEKQCRGNTLYGHVHSTIQVVHCIAISLRLT